MHCAAVHQNYLTTIMAGVIKRNNTWVACIKVGGKEVRISTKVAIVPAILKPGGGTGGRR